MAGHTPLPSRDFYVPIMGITARDPSPLYALQTYTGLQDFGELTVDYITAPVSGYTARPTLTRQPGYG